MNAILFQRADASHKPLPEAATEPDFSGLDSAEDIVKDALRMGLIDDLRALLRENGQLPEMTQQTALIRDLAYEFAGTKDRDLAVDLFIHVTGIAEFGPASLRDYAAKHGCSHEWFRLEAEKMRRRLGLAAPAPTTA